MRVRFSILLTLLMFILLGLLSFDPIEETYVGMQVQTISGKPYLTLSDISTFSIFTPSGKDFTEWTPIFPNRSGEVLGSFELPPASKPTVALPTPNLTPEIPTISAPLDKPAVPLENFDEGLGVFFKNRCGLFRVNSSEKDSSVASFPIALEWNPEASSHLKGETFAFGAKLDKPTAEGGMPNGVLKSARFDGKEWVEVAGVTGPQVRSGKAGFWLKSVPLEGRIAVLWRGAKWDQTIDARVEGLRIATDGDIGMCFFDGTKFSAEPLVITGLPKGNTSIWSENGMIKCLVQTRFKSKEEPGQKGRMEIWTISPEGKAKLAETIKSPSKSIGLFSYIAAERFMWGNREYILRSNWQRFEVWKRTDSGAWELMQHATAGLPVYSLERKLFGALGFCACVVLFGALLGFLRRRHALTLLRNLQPGDLNAPLASRAGAYLIDMLIVIALAIGASQIIPEQISDEYSVQLGNAAIPLSAIAVCFMVYFTLTEWLLGATLGKFVMGLRVVSDNGMRPTFWAAAVRNTVGLLERQPMMIIVSFPMVVFSPRRQRLGDLLSRTIVVQKQGLDMFLAQRAAAALRGESLDTLPGDPLDDQPKKERAD
ncbi:MAG: RDD family protein [Planctomycetota bacterium]